MTKIVLISVLVGLVSGLVIFYLIWGKRLKAGDNKNESLNYSTKAAEEMLRQAGYQVRDRRVKKTVITSVNGQDHVGYVEADYLVRKDKNNYAVLVHYTAGDPEPNEPAFRRRLIEIGRAFAPAKMLVLDLNKGEIHQVTHRFPRDWSLDVLFNVLIGLFIIAVIIGIIWMLATLKLI